jgi:hypothetical protein
MMAITFGEAMLIKNNSFLQQIKDFRGLRFNSISPTDIDGFLDFGNRLFVFIETKFGDSQLQYGQRLALERLCDATHNPPSRNSIVLITRHDTQVSEKIDLAESIVFQYRFDKKWASCKPISLLDTINLLRIKYLSNK